MNRGQLRLEVRRVLGELTESTSLWTDNEINDWLNEGAMIMTAIAQPYECFHAFTCALQPGSTTAYLAEYPLGEDVDEVFAVWINDGTEERPLRRAGKISGIRETGVPSHFYLRGITDQTMELRDGGFSIQPINPAVGRGRFVLGLNPAPAGAYVARIAYYGRHFLMKNDFEVPLIPPEYRRGLVNYAESMARQKDDDPEKAAQCLQSFSNFAEKLKARMVDRGDETEMPSAMLWEEEPFGGKIELGWSTG